MAINYIDVISEQIPASNTTVYTSPTVSSGHILAATVFNESGSNATLTANIVQSGGTVGVTNQYVNVIVPAGKPVVLQSLINLTLKTSDFISFNAGTASALNLKMTIKEISV